MIDPKNTVNLTCGIVADPEFATDEILKLRVAADYAGSEKGSGTTSGYFNVTYYLNGDNQKNAQFVKTQVKDGKMKKGSQIQIIGRLVQERWQAEDGKGRDKVVIVAEGLTYAGGGRPAEGAQSGAQAVISAPDEF